MTILARFSDRGELRSAVLRRDHEVFEGEAPFEVIAHADQRPLECDFCMAP